MSPKDEELDMARMCHTAALRAEDPDERLAQATFALFHATMALSASDIDPDAPIDTQQGTWSRGRFYPATTGWFDPDRREL